MQLNEDQNKCLELVKSWLEGDAWSFNFGGNAGTGKTFLLQYFIKNYNGERPIICCTPTGKAASVLSSKIDEDIPIMTLHSALYSPVEINGELRFLDKAPEIDPSNLVIVDEASMVSNKIREDLKKTKAKVLFCGDPMQLPPVNSLEWFNFNTLNASLTEIQRQSLESPIIRLSQDIINSKVDIKNYQNSDCQILSKDKMTTEDWLASDQVLTGKNKTRHKSNRFFRKMLGYQGKFPVKGEKVICLKNEIRKEQIFINGVIAKTISDVKTITVERGDKKYKNKVFSLEYEGNEVEDIVFYEYPFLVHYDVTAKSKNWEQRRPLREFDFGYAITVHKSQGSEWDHVILADDGIFKSDQAIRNRWLYTAVTRAKKRLQWVYN